MTAMQAAAVAAAAAAALGRTHQSSATVIAATTATLWSTFAGSLAASLIGRVAGFSVGQLVVSDEAPSTNNRSS